ncbi:endonuclease III domain-containing protein [Sediminispirochaeta bajacaliforniensis]|uniref:endonuclease III domain-containing protein n=1 Tax=Sediminispirochaeta bajacaliforniensis TaxID=148 RepID=UPI00047541AD|nr:HhH-GPD family protein [Sediminispirochaeta bajacaliforniensis]
MIEPQTLYQLFMELYGPRGWWPVVTDAGKQGHDAKGYHPLDYSIPDTAHRRFEIALGAILTQNTAWRNVRLCLEALDEAGAIDMQHLLSLSDERLEALIRPSGYYRQKARKLKTLARFFLENGYGEVSAASTPSREELLSLWGIGEETADSILLYAFGVPVLVIDAYTRRILARLKGEELSDREIRGYLSSATEGKDVEQQRRILNEFHALFVEHGKNRCAKRSPDCERCGIKAWCKGPF